MSQYVDGQLVVSSEVKDLYESENQNLSITGKNIIVLDPKDEDFLNILINYIEKEWGNPILNSNDICHQLGYSKSQFYRKMIAITAKSPNRFIKEYRLTQALKLLKKRKNNISEIAFETGFNTPAYFSKCFLEAFGILPSDYIRQISV